MPWGSRWSNSYGGAKPTLPRKRLRIAVDERKHPMGSFIHLCITFIVVDFGGNMSILTSLTDIQIQSLIMVGITILVAIVIGFVIGHIEKEEERKRTKRIIRRLNHERNYGNVYDRF